MAGYRDAVGYLRVSGLSQLGNGGIPRQHDAIQALAKVQRLRIVGSYEDQAVSGMRDMDERPNLARLMNDVEEGRVKVVVVENITRLARDAIIAQVILKKMADAGAVVYDGEGYNLTAGDDEPQAKLIQRVLAAIAEYDRTITVMKLRDGRLRKRKAEGRCEGRKPYGWTEAEREVITKMRRWRSRGQSLRAIATRLNDRGTPTRMAGRSWYPSTVQRILGRPTPQFSEVAKKAIESKAEGRAA